ncbi:MAG: tetratricopeptide repeat protein [Anaerolineae bacterium]|nr:tetratricopeptide repeat protein [Anaerolineae bacterium]MCA9893863.1 tetratricopeptide repeat protein [Anaerolineae bacterium]
MNRSGAQLRAGIGDLMALGEFQRVIDICKKTLVAARDARDPITEALSLVGLAASHRALGKYKDALILANGAIEQSQKAHMPEVECDALLERASILRIGQLQFYEARDDYREALNLGHEIGYEAGVSQSLCGLAVVMLKVDQVGTVHAYAREALDIATEINDVSLQIEALNVLGLYYIAVKNHDLALQALSDALARAMDKKFAISQAYVLDAIGELHMAMKQPDKALSYFGRAYEIARQSHYAALQSSIMLHLGTTYVAQEDYSEARKCYDSVVRKSEEMDMPIVEAQASLHIATLHLHLREPAIALDYQRRSVDIAHRSMNPFFESQSLQQLAMTQRAMGHFEQAIESFNAALNIERSLDNDKAVREIIAAILWTQVLGLVDKVLRLLHLRQESDQD